MDKPKHVVIAGAGVIGTSTAYFLASNYGIRSTIVDPTGTIAPAASGKAGGFLARDWNDNTPTEHLTHRSFDLHQQLADTFGAGSIQYRRLTCAAISVNPYAPKPQGKKLQGLEWTAQALSIKSLGDERTIAQVHPKLLCDRLWSEASSKADCALVKAKVVTPEHEDGKLHGVRLDNGEIIEADALLFACGPWTANIMYGVKYHAVIVPTDKVLSQCVFFSGCGDPEVYVRPDQTAYCTGYPDPPIRVTESPGREEVRQDKIETILESVRDAAGAREAGVGAMSKEPVKTQACYLPTTKDGIPVMGMLPEDTIGGGQCYIAAGHSCWGILLGPASGEAMASLIATGKSLYVDLDRFNPLRYRGEIQLTTFVEE